MRINPGNPPAAAKRPTVTKGPPPQEKCWRFSFRYWQQIEAFGLGGVDPGWFQSLLDRFKQLSAEPLSRFLDDPLFQNEIRYHEIDWNWRNIPIQRSNLDWLPNEILDNAAEFPIYQVHISRAMGRVVGFWDADWIFNILLLDPNHNCQPSRYSEYRVRPTSIGQCEYSSLRLAIERAQGSRCEHEACDFRKSVVSIQDKLYDDHNVVIARVDDTLIIELRRLVENGKAKDISEVLEYGIAFFE